MPKGEHIHIVTNSKYKHILENLGTKHGSMTKAIEYALDIIDKNQSTNSCIDCDIKKQYELEESFNKQFNLITFPTESIRDLVKYLLGDISATEFMLNVRRNAYNFGKQYLSYLKISKLENNYENLLSILEELKKVTKLLTSIQVDKFNSQIIGQVNIFENIPILVAIGLIGYLEAFNFTFDIEISDYNIIIKWIHPEKFPFSVNIEEKFQNFIHEASLSLKPFMIKQGFLYSSPTFLDWIDENLLPFQILPFEAALNFSQVPMGGFRVIKNALQMAKLCESLILQVNYAERVDIKVNNENTVFKLKIICRTPHLTRILFDGFLVTLSKFGWKVQQHRIEYKLLELSFQYVGPDDPTILDPLFINNFMAYLNQRFQKQRVVSVDEYDDLTSALYESNPEKFREVFRRQSLKFANALKLLSKNDINKMREIGISLIFQHFKYIGRELDSTNLIAESDKITIIFKTMNLVEQEIFKELVLGVLEEFQYKNLKARIIENMLTVEFTRPLDAKPNLTAVQKEV